ncbi:hypothetical protein H6G54_15360 [Anabaena cylindrica FACHB-243]|uniref:Uncharacterized protein n=1 Tax=Anabaena cylindrica (strain ATCC 27899 / PCC 7122) TaxID=272123 RepID=K9ZIL5_ANACC|nr:MULTISPECIES: hypothetical protein [Anabaena]AFZ58175.1 hypothetical protein Anacy_2739 [Anabaena cylindrica PCC 7122]MBD2419049.1 hypothetical protein [Anabaena cylindrica FACHB-243]MBY5281197.1 hypothetical protein [Anabaena sp. CCAP 1446/1C]MBY5310266.1 hypothetical protein [Anabaena sp. CCAP 1446/1C]MCM2409518.1 hypothetical protein [Anabaena sp. CCAP 1446/1C]
MSDKVQPNPDQAPTHDAQLAAEQIANGEEKAPKVDFEADYAAAQQFSVSEIDRTGEGKIAAEAATAPKYEVSESEETKTEAQPTGNPDDYVEMAKEIGASRTEAVTSVSDDLIQQAFKKGEAARK